MDENEEAPFDADTEYCRLIQEIDQDGYIIIESKTLVEYGQMLENGTEANYWREEQVTEKHSFNDIEWIKQGGSWVSVKEARQEDGSAFITSWPITSIVSVTERTNSNEVTKSIEDMVSELREKVYAKRGIDFLEEALNHMGPHGPGCDCPPDEEDHHLAVTLSEDDSIGNPCSIDHHRAVLSDTGIWTCLDCASQWDQEGKLI
jgi:hypothetical protein